MLTRQNPTISNWQTPLICLFPNPDPPPAGPLFDAGEMDFYNLELADTNVVDHNTHHYGRDQGLAFQVVD
jgi:hypothetical protein